MRKIIFIGLVIILMISSISVPKAETASNGKIICIDPGHQEKSNTGKEPVSPNSPLMKTKVSSGTQGVVTRIPEYKFTLNVGLKLEKLLQSRGYQVYMTRKVHKVDLSNIDRANFCNQKKSDLIIRIHADGSTNKKANGIHILYPSGSVTSQINSKSKEAAELMISELIKASGANLANKNGVSSRTDITGFNWSKYPVVLPELGFMSNAEEDRKLADSSYQDKLALGMANGVDKFFGINSSAPQRSFIANNEITIYNSRQSGRVETGKLEKGKTYQILKSWTSWYEIKVADQIGYVRVSDALAPASTKRFFIANKNLSVYNTRSGNRVEIAKINKGETYSILKSWTSWYEIKISNQIGYIRNADTVLLNSRNRYFTANQDIPIYNTRAVGRTEIGRIELGQTYPISKSWASWYEVKVGNTIGYIRNYNTIQLISKQRYFIALEDITVFNARSGTRKAISVVTKGQKYSIAKSWTSWYEIRIGNTKGYIRKENTKLVTPEY